MMLVLSLLVGATSVVAQDKKPTPPKDIARGTLKSLDENVIPAILANDPGSFLASITPIIERAKPRQLAAIEKYGKAAGAGSIQGRFADLVLQQVEQGTFNMGRKPSTAIALYLTDELVSRVNGGIQQLKTHPVMSDPLAVPEDWQDSEQLFWEVHVFKNEFLNARQMVQFGVQVLSPHLKQIEKSNDPAQMKVAQSLERLTQDLPATYREMREREMEMRLIRFNKSSKELHAPGDFEKHLTAAMCMELDAERLIEFFRDEQQEPSKRVALNDPKLPETIMTMVKNGRQVGDHISYKAILLRSGMHYWLRGRYGQGPLAFGLLKSPESMNSTYAMEGLYMPKQRPRPISIYHGGESSQPGYDRRHFYTWAVEYRPLIKEAGYKDKSRSAGIEVISAQSQGSDTGTFW